MSVSAEDAISCRWLRVDLFNESSSGVVRYLSTLLFGYKLKVPRASWNYDTTDRAETYAGIKTRRTAPEHILRSMKIDSFSAEVPV